jgi:hypothetical protein
MKSKWLPMMMTQLSKKSPQSWILNEATELVEAFPG